MWAIKGRIAYPRLSYCKVKNTENSGTEWDEITLETVWKIDRKALKVILSFNDFFQIIVFKTFPLIP